MRILSLLMFFLAIGLVGCGEGIQRGRFSTVSSRMIPLEPTTGCLQVVSGYALAADGRHVGDMQDLLYVLVICPGVDPRYNGISEDSKRDTTTLKYQWGDKVSVSVSWDRQADTFSTGSQTFDRSKGNVFVVRRGNDGKITGQQLKSLDAKGHYLLSEKVILHIREQLPGDALVAALRASMPEP